MRLVSSRFRTTIVVVLALAGLLAATASATAAVRVQVSGSSPRPSVGDRWTLTVKARKDGRTAAGRVRVDVIMDGKVVRTLVNGAPLRGGRWSITQKWPGISKGLTMTFRATVSAGGQRGVGSYTVRVRG
jgi:hypothetical protein